MAGRNKLIFVTGATGKQGGAVVNHLLKEGYQIKALTRSPGSEQARKLKERGVEIIEGDLYNPGSFRQHIKDAFGVFAVQNFWEHGYQGEVEQGKALINAVKDSNVQHFIYNSVASCTRNTGLAHFDSKKEIEDYIKEKKLAYTIFRPVFFMENFIGMRNEIFAGKLVSAMEENVPLQMIAVDDIGAFVTQAFSNPDIYMGKEIELAGDSKTYPEVASILSSELGEPVSYVKLSLKEFENIVGKETAQMVDWFNRVGYDVDIEALKSNYDVELTTFKEWLHKINFAQFKIKQYK
ncbi:MAG: NmrA/HSCARG family protein [Ignavibacteria bacterium]|nr:NmrA/HSCARG family protein [Ignavibacteria bacterium]MCU7503296.1 NmrA/HSCARG family protein [Ignavibacteria bacterium]MCU7515758.1 NmrA/HSCARG family protein [Ignavibacteria bacterium]